MLAYRSWKAFTATCLELKLVMLNSSFVLQVGVCDPVHVFVHWQCHGEPAQDGSAFVPMQLVALVDCAG